MPITGDGWSKTARRMLKRGLALAFDTGDSSGATLLIYHRVGGGTNNELDVEVETFRRQLDLLSEHDIVTLDAALDRLQSGDRRPCVVLTFDDGFEDVYRNAWPLLRERQLPFTIYLATAWIGQMMQWEGATAKGEPGRGLSWDQIREMVDSGLCTLGNHTHHHVRPQELTEEELDACSAAIQAHTGRVPDHFTYPWGIPVPAMEDVLRRRFRSVSTGELGLNLPGQDFMRLNRVPVRRTDPDSFFAAKLTGDLAAERRYARLVSIAKAGLGLLTHMRRLVRSA